MIVECFVNELGWQMRGKKAQQVNNYNCNVLFEVKLWFVAASIPISVIETTCKDIFMAFSALIRTLLQLLQ